MTPEGPMGKLLWHLNLIIGKVQMFHVKDDIINNGRGVDCFALDALGRLSGNRYCSTKSVIESETN